MTNGNNFQICKGECLIDQNLSLSSGNERMGSMITMANTDAQEAVIRRKYEALQPF